MLVETAALAKPSRDKGSEKVMCHKERSPKLDVIFAGKVVVVSRVCLFAKGRRG